MAFAITGLTWLARALVARFRRRATATGRALERVSNGVERVVLVTTAAPRSLEDLLVRLELADWAAAAPDRELVVIQRSRPR